MRIELVTWRDAGGEQEGWLEPDKIRRREPHHYVGRIRRQRDGEQLNALHGLGRRRRYAHSRTYP